MLLFLSNIDSEGLANLYSNFTASIPNNFYEHATYYRILYYTLTYYMLPYYLSNLCNLSKLKHNLKINIFIEIEISIYDFLFNKNRTYTSLNKTVQTNLN